MTPCDALCALCGEPIGTRPHGSRTLPRQPTEYAHVDCADLQRRRAMRVAYSAQLDRAIARIPDWPWARVGSSDLERAVPDRRLRGFAEKWEPERGPALLLGASGAGKTTACVALVRRLRDELAAIEDPPRVPSPAEYDSHATAWSLGVLHSLVWTTGHVLAYARRNAPLGAEPELLRTCRGATLLITDEVGSEPLSDGVLFEIVDHRYSCRTPTIVTSGYSRAEFCARYGDALFRRLTQFGTLVDLWPKPKPELREVASGG